MTPYYDEDGIQIWHGDCRDVLPTLEPASFELMIADPPYGMAKEAKGVANDNLHGRKLDWFQMSWLLPALTVLKAESSLYIWGLAADLWRLWYAENGLAVADPTLSVANEIVWRKDTQTGQKSPANRSFVESERALFLLRGDQKFSINSDVFFEGYEPIRNYLAKQADLAGFGPREVGKITGTASMWPRWFSRSQWHMMRCEHYEALEKASGGYAFVRPYDVVRGEYEEAKVAHDAERAEFYAQRAYFSADESTTDVWSFPVPKGFDRHGHETPKPVPAMVRAISASCPPGGTVLDPFMGVAAVPRAVKDLGRKCVAIELNEKYCEIAVRRLAQESLGFGR